MTYRSTSFIFLLDWMVQGATETEGNTENAGASSSAERLKIIANIIVRFPVLTS